MTRSPVPWITALCVIVSSGAFAQDATRAVVGHFDGGVDPDVCQLRAGGVELHYAPAAFDVVYPMGLSALDLSVVPGAAPGGADAIATVGPAGLLQSHYVGGDPAQLFVHTVVAVGGWTGATRVLVPRDDSTHFVGVDAAGTGLLVFDGASTGNISLPGAMRDLVLLDWDGDGVDEVFLVLDSRVLVLERDGTTLFQRTQPNTEAFAARVAGDPADRVAYVVTPQGGSEQLLFTLDASAIEPPVSLGSFDVGSLVAGDVDGDGAEDLVTMLRSPETPADHVLLRLHNQSSVGGTSTFTLGALTRWELGVGANPGPEQRAWPVLAPFARDGELDVALFVETVGDLVLGWNETTDHVDHELTITASHGKYCANNGNRWYVPTISVPAEILSGATDLVVEQWNARIDAGEVLIDPHGVAKTLYTPATAAGPYVIELDGYYGADLRYLRLYHAVVDQEEIVAAGPVTTVAVTFDESVAIELAGLGANGGIIDVYVYDAGQSCSHTTTPGGTPMGGSTSDPPRPPCVDDDGTGGVTPPP